MYHYNKNETSEDIPEEIMLCISIVYSYVYNSNLILTSLVKGGCSEIYNCENIALHIS